MRDWDDETVYLLYGMLPTLGSLYNYGEERGPHLRYTIRKLQSLNLNSATIKAILNSYGLPLDDLEDDGSTDVDKDAVEFFSDEVINAWIDDEASDVKAKKEAKNGSV